MSGQATPGKELTLRGLVLGVALTLPFTAANMYLGLKVGLTFATHSSDCSAFSQSM